LRLNEYDLVSRRGAVVKIGEGRLRRVCIAVVGLFPSALEFDAPALPGAGSDGRSSGARRDGER
jgi:hypothetical protein